MRAIFRSANIYFLIGIISLAGGLGYASLPNRSTPASAFGPFVNMEVHGNGGVYDLGHRRFLMITPGYFVASARIIKTADGRTLYIFVDEVGLHVVNAMNGDHLRDLPFYKMPRLDAFNRKHAELEFHAEVEGDVVAVLPALEKRSWHGVDEQPWLRLNLKSGKIETGDLTPARLGSAARWKLNRGTQMMASAKKSDRET